MHFRLVTIVAIILLLLACGSKGPVKEQGPLINDHLKIFTYGDAYKPLEKKLRLIHGRELSASLAQQTLFASSEYVGDGRDISGYDTTLRVTFLYAQQGQSEWPLEIKAHYILENNGTTLFNDVYQVTATQYNTPKLCAGCSAEQAALKMLQQKILPELKTALQD